MSSNKNKKGKLQVVLYILETIANIFFFSWFLEGKLQVVLDTLETIANIFFFSWFLDS